MSPTPPQKRHHLPFSMLGGGSACPENGAVGSPSKSRSNSARFATTPVGKPLLISVSSFRSSLSTKGRNVLVAICVVSFVLQFCGSLYSWTNHAHNYLTRTLVSSTAPGVRRATATTTAGAVTSPDAVLHDERRRRTLDIVVTTGLDDAALADGAVAGVPVHRQYGPPPHTRRLRVLFGILTADFKNDYAYRKRHRALFQLWNDARVCSLPDFKSRPLETRYECEIIYTFVMGGNPEADPVLVDESRPYEVTKPIKGLSPDINEPDVTLLNIRENMNEGKSQTWMKYGAEIALEYDLDYVTKCDADALLHLHEFFAFAYVHMPPAPYNQHVYIGALRDKAYWPRHSTEAERIRFESYFGNNFEGVHLYVAGQIYIVSTDLAAYVGREALRSKCEYCEGHEDHDISALAFHSPEPIKLMVIGRSHRFWEHPVKGEPRWKRMWAREQARMAGAKFEGKMFFKNSTFEASMERRARQQKHWAEDNAKLVTTTAAAAVEKERHQRRRA